MLCPPMFTALDHVVIAVRDLDAAGRSYASLLGRAPSWRGSHPGAGTSNLLFRLENNYVELLAGTKLDEGLVALAFATDDADASWRGCKEQESRRAACRGEGRESASGAVRAGARAFLRRTATRALSCSRSSLSPPGLTFAQATALRGHGARARSRGCGERRSRGRPPLVGEALPASRARRRFQARGLRILFFRVGGVTLEVAGPLEPPAEPSTADRFGGLAYRVADVALARARLALTGVDVSSVRPGAKPGTLVCSVRAGTASVPTLLIGPAGPPTDGRES